MAGEIVVEEARKELEGILEKEKSTVQKSIEAAMPEAERKALATKKAEDEKKAEETRITVEAQAKADAELLVKKDEEIKDEAEKKRKVELLEKQRKDEEGKLSSEEKVKRIKEETQKRIDEMSNSLKEIKDKTSREAEKLRLEIETLRKEKTEKPEDIIALVEKEENEKNIKYLEEDKSLSREKRREMDDAEIDDWLLEDQKSAIAWIQRRELRREIDKRQNFFNKQRDGMSRKLYEKQAQSYVRVVNKHPELDVKNRKAELKTQGKSEEEIETVLRTENKKYATIMQIAEENPDWKFELDAPEKAMVEMEKRLEKTSNTEDKSEIEKLQEKMETLEAEIARLTSTDEGVTSTLQRKTDHEKAMTEAEKAIVETMKNSKATQAMIDSALKRFREKKK